jgi:hypothetical protein
MMGATKRLTPTIRTRDVPMVGVGFHADIRRPERGYRIAIGPDVPAAFLLACAWRRRLAA